MSNDTTVTLRVRLPESQLVGQAAYVNHVLTTFTGAEVMLTFSQVIPPPAIPGDALPAFLESGVVDATVVSRLVMTPEKFVAFVESVGALVHELRRTGHLPSGSEGENGS